MKRRAVLAGLGAAALSRVAAPALAQGAKARVVVVGAGFGGATAARFLTREGLDVTLVERESRYVACPFSNLVVAGLRGLDAQTFGFDGLKREGIAFVAGDAQAVDPHARRIRLADGTGIPFDRLVLAPGVEFVEGGLDGYDEAAAEAMPHAWKAGPQTELLARKLQAMEDGDTVVMSVPPNPYRCPPGPYERASLIAHYLKTRKPRSKLIVLDAKDAFSKQRLFQAAWARLYPGLLEYVPLSGGGRVTRVNAPSLEVVTEFETYRPAVANIIPPQRAGAVARAAGAADRSGWCPIDPVTFESRLTPLIHVIGDAAIAGAMPKSAFAANAQGKVCAAAVAALLRGETPAEPRLINTCYSLVAPDYGISVAGVYRPAKGLLADIEGAGGTSPLDAGDDFRADEARYAEDWFATVTSEAFG